MKKISVKSEKGAVTLLVLVTILFFVMVLMSIYILVSNKTQSQIEMTRETRRVYEQETAKDVYSSFFGDNIIPIYTAEQFKEIGSNKNIPIDEVGAKYYKFSATSTYVLMNDLEFENSGVLTVNFEGDGRIEGNGHEVKIKDTSKAQEVYYYYNASNNYETAIIGNIVYDGLILYYDGINNTGNGHSNAANVWKDLSKNGNDAAHRGTSSLTWANEAYNFSTPNTNYFETANTINIADGARTIELVVSIEQAGTTSTNLIGWGSTTANTMADIMYHANGLQLHAYGNGANEGISTANTWAVSEVVSGSITYDASKTGYRINNEFKEDVAFFPLNTANTTLFLGIGKYAYWNVDKAFKIQSCRIYDRVLTQSEREQNYNIDKVRYGIQ